MRTVSDQYGGNFLKADDIDKKGQKLLIDEIEDELMDGKFVIVFADCDQRLVLNKTNAGIIADKLGDDVDKWPGATLELRQGRTRFRGKMVACIEVTDAAFLTNGHADGEPPQSNKKPKS